MKMSSSPTSASAQCLGMTAGRSRRAGDTVGLEGLLDEAVERAYKIVCENDDAKPDGRELSDEARRAVAQKVGIGALKYADLSQNRTSDYVFSYDKMLAMNGNTATYMQYAYARVRSIFRRGGVDIEALRARPAAIRLTTPAERRWESKFCALPRLWKPCWSITGQIN